MYIQIIFFKSIVARLAGRLNRRRIIRNDLLFCNLCTIHQVDRHHKIAAYSSISIHFQPRALRIYVADELFKAKYSAFC